MALVSKIIAQKAGRAEVAEGDMVDVAVDRVYVQDGNSPTIARLFQENGFDRVFDPAAIGLFFDHSVLPPNVAIADRLEEAKSFARTFGVEVYGQGRGISHVVAMEKGWFRPGDIVLGADSHTCVGGAVQALALGMGASDIAAAMVSGRTWLKVPRTVWIEVAGTPHPAARPRDVVLRCLAEFGQEPFLYAAVEWCGDWARSLSSDGAASVASLGVELGAKCVFLPDRPGAPAGLRALAPDPGGEVFRLDAEGMGPMVSKPHSPGDAVPLDTLAGTRFDHVFVGSCTNSRSEDIADVARLLVGRTVHPDVHLVVTPGSREVYIEGVRRGHVEALVAAGALVTPPGCGACVGAQGSIPASGSKVLSTMNRNFLGRMGNPEAEIYLANPLVAATTALTGALPNSKDILTWK